MLRIVTTLAMLTVAPLAAQAQTIRSQTQTTVGGYSYQTLVSDNTSLGAQRGAEPDASDVQCLERKKSGRLECHTYAQWVVIAKALEAKGK